MRLILLVIAALLSNAAMADSFHKCQKPDGAVYYTDKACSSKNTRDRKPVLDQGSDTQQPAPPPPQKKKRHARK